MFFTDDSHTGSSFNNAEETITWTVPSGGLSVGQVVLVNDVATTPVFDVPDGSTAGAMLGLAVSGDNIFVLEGNDRTGSPLFGINIANASPWRTDNSASFGLSSLIPALNVAGGNLDTSLKSSLDNGKYNGSIMSFASVALAKASVMNLDNWTFANTTASFALDSTDFTITPEPSTLAMLLFGALGMMLFRKRRRS